MADFEPPQLPDGFRELYIDRPHILEQLSRRLRRRERRRDRIVFLTGPAGSGKTWLAHALIRRARSFPAVDWLGDERQVSQFVDRRVPASEESLIVVEADVLRSDRWLFDLPIFGNTLALSRKPDVPRWLEMDRINVGPLNHTQAGDLTMKILGRFLGLEQDEALLSSTRQNAGELTLALKRLAKVDPAIIDSLEVDDFLAMTRAEFWDRPLISVVPDITPEFIKFLKDDPRELANITPEKFEHLVADRFEAMGYNVTLAGPTNRKDGGVDIIATRRDRMFGDYAVAGQVKHHRGDQKTDREAVDRLISLKGGVFSFGMLVTNTTFTEDAKWAAAQQNAKFFAKLRDINALKNWLEENFAGEKDYRELPDEIELAPGVKIVVPRPKIVLR